MPKLPASLAILSLLLLAPMSAAAQEVIRIEPPTPMPFPNGPFGPSGPGQNPIDLHSTLSGPTAAPQPSPNLGGTVAAPAPAPAANESTPEPAPLLLSAHSSGDGSGSECDITEAARQSCSGTDCVLSCSPDSCAGQESDKCEFVVDCTAEILTEAASGEQQCDEQYVEHATIENAGRTTPVAIVRIPVGQTCKPPPCMK